MPVAKLRIKGRENDGQVIKTETGNITEYIYIYIYIYIMWIINKIKTYIFRSYYVLDENKTFRDLYISI